MPKPLNVSDKKIKQKTSPHQKRKMYIIHYTFWYKHSLVYFIYIECMKHLHLHAHKQVLL